MFKSTKSKILVTAVTFCLGLACLIYFVIVKYLDNTHMPNNIDPRYGAAKYYKETHELLMNRAKGVQIDLLFLGDSITSHWLIEGKDVWTKQFGDWYPGNFGLPGDTTYGVLWRLKQNELKGLHPKAVVLLIGTNDLSVGMDPRVTSEAIKTIIENLKSQLPDTTVVLIGVLPRGSASDDVRQPLKEVNLKISKFDNGADVRYIDIGSHFVDAKGELIPGLMIDGLHLTSKGYEVFAESIKPTLTEILVDRN